MNPYVFGGIAVVAVLVLFFTAASNKLKLRRYFLKSPKVSEEISILHISDLHSSRFGKRQKKLLSMIRYASPDIIVMTGDMVEDKEKSCVVLSEGSPERCFFEGAVKVAPCYAVLGNHERFVPDVEALVTELDEIGISLLHPSNGEGLAMVNCGEMIIYGASDPYFTYEAINRCERNLKQIFAEDKDRKNDRIENWRRKIEADAKDIGEKKELTVLLSHRPEEYELYEKMGFDVIFSGHAHGGQWRLPPFINGVYAPHQGIFPKHAGGTYELKNGLHIVSRGLSKKRMIRIFNRPELCLLKVIPAREEKI